VPDSVSEICLVSAQDILKTCHPKLFPPRQPPTIWFDIYDRTAREFRMKLITVHRRANIQALAQLPCRFTQSFYVGSVGSVGSARNKSPISAHLLEDTSERTQLERGIL
jgi:hypothetical protein